MSFEENFLEKIKNQDLTFCKDIAAAMRDAVIDQCALSKIWAPIAKIDPSEICEDKDSAPYIPKAASLFEMLAAPIIPLEDYDNTSKQHDESSNDLKNTRHFLPIMRHATPKYTMLQSDMRRHPKEYSLGKIAHGVTYLLSRSIDKYILQSFELAASLAKQQIITICPGVYLQFLDANDLTRAASNMADSSCARWIILHPGDLVQLYRNRHKNIELTLSGQLPCFTECSQKDLSKDEALVNGIQSGKLQCWLDNLEVIVTEEIGRGKCYIIKNKDHVGDLLIGDGDFEMSVEFGQVKFQAQIEIAFNVKDVETIYKIESA